MATENSAKPVLAERSSLLADLRIIVLGSWGFIRQLLLTWRRSPGANEHHPPP